MSAQPPPGPVTASAVWRWWWPRRPSRRSSTWQSDPWRRGWRDAARLGHRRRWSQNGDEKSMGLASKRRASPGRSVKPPQLPLRLSPGAPTCSPAGTGTIPQQPPISRQRAPKRRHALGRNQQQRQQHHGSGSSSCAARKQQQLWPGRPGFLSLRVFANIFTQKLSKSIPVIFMILQAFKDPSIKKCFQNILHVSLNSKRYEIDFDVILERGRLYCGKSITIQPPLMEHIRQK